MGEAIELYNLVHKKVKYPRLTPVADTMKFLDENKELRSLCSSFKKSNKKLKSNNSSTTLDNESLDNEIIFKPKLPKSFYLAKLRDWAEEIPITGLLPEWEISILRLVPSEWKKKYPQRLTEVLIEIREIYLKNMQEFAVRHIVVSENENESLDVEESKINSPEELKMRTENFGTGLFLRRKMFLRNNYFLSHSLMRNIIATARQKLVTLIVDFSEYRCLGLLDVDELQGMITKSIRNRTLTIKHEYYKVISKLLSRKKCLANIKSKKRQKFLKCATNLFVQQILNNMMETIDKMIETVENYSYCPQMNFELLIRDYNDEVDDDFNDDDDDYHSDHGGEIIKISPSIEKVCKIYHQVIVDIENIGTNDLLSFKSSIPSDYSYDDDESDFMTIKIPDWFIKKSHEKLENVLRFLFSPLEQYFSQVREEFHYAYTPDTKENILYLVSRGEKFNVYCEHVKKLNKYIQKSNAMIAFLYFDVGRLSQVKAKETLRRNISSMIEILVKKLLTHHWEYNESICSEFEALEILALDIPNNTKSLFELSETISVASTTTVDKLEKKIVNSIQMLSDLLQITSLTGEHIEFNKKTINWLSSIKAVFNESNTLCEAMKSELEDALQRKINVLNVKVDVIIPEFIILDDMDDATRVSEYMEYLEILVDKINDVDENIKAINMEEKLFKFPETSFPKVDDIKDIVMPFYSLNRKIFQWRRHNNVWLDGPFEYINSEEVSGITNFYYDEFTQFNRTMKIKIKSDMTASKPLKFSGLIDDPDPMQQPAPIKLSFQAIEHVNDFKQYVPLVNCMCNPALASRHWNEMSTIYGSVITPNAGTTLRKIIALDLIRDIEKYEVISISANKELNLQRQLDTMIEEWDDILFDIVYENPIDKESILIFRNFQEIQIRLEEHLVMTEEMKGSHFVKPIAKTVIKFYRSLTTVRDTIERWNCIQDEIISIRPVFTKVRRVLQIHQLETIGLIYSSIEETLNDIQNGILEDPTFCGIGTSLYYVERLIEVKKKLEIVNEGVNEYLNSIRFVFPRFFFLSNIEIMNILFNKNDNFIEKVRALLRKSFTGIRNIRYTVESDVLSIVNYHGDELQLIQKISSPSGDNERQHIWLTETETSIIKTVKENIRELIFIRKDCEIKNILSSLATCNVFRIHSIVACVLKILWTMEIERCFMENFNDDIPFNSALKELNETIIKVIREITSMHQDRVIKRNQKIAILSLSIFLIHQREVIALLNNKNISNANDFNWVAQLRHYWYEDDVKVKMIYETKNYGYEFNSFAGIHQLPIVNTLLTDRVYRTIFEAARHNFFGAVTGCTGTGKTETIRNLASTELGMQFKIIDCTEDLKFYRISGVLKGLISSGAWICLKNIDRTRASVLSATSQYIYQISKILASYLKTVDFEGDSLMVNPNGFVTMTTVINPGHFSSLRLENIPDNMRILFRSSTLTRPDFRKICEVQFSAAGFSNAMELARKIEITSKLGLEQLNPPSSSSLREQYYFGSRTLMSVVRNSIELKFKFPEESEDSIVLRALIDVHLPMLKKNDIMIFQGFIDDLFPGVNLPPPNYTKLLEALEKTAIVEGIQVHQVMKLKIIQMIEMMHIRNSFMLVGESLSGKTTTLRVLTKCLSLLHSQGDSIGVQVISQTINQKSIGLKYIFGYETDDNQWVDGIFTTILREYMKSDEKRIFLEPRKWIIFDGPLDCEWTEKLTAVLDQNKTLFLASGESIKITDSVSLIFETENLSEASPTMVSRCGVIYLDAKTIGWKPYAKCWIDQQKFQEKHQRFMVNLIEWSMEPCLNFIQQKCQCFIRVSDIYLVTSALRLLKIFLKDAVEIMGSEDNKDTHFEIWCHASLIMSIVWSFGGVLSSHESRTQLDEFCVSLWSSSGDVGKMNPKPELIKTFDVALPNEGLIQDNTYIFKGVGIWKSWADILKNSNENNESGCYSIVPTIESVKLTHFFTNHIQQKVPFIICGDGSIGKTSLMRYLLKYKITQAHHHDYITNFPNFTSETSAEEAQRLFFLKLNKITQGQYAPPKKKFGINFIDDLNLTIHNEGGRVIQPPLEVIRQLLDHGYWYMSPSGHRKKVEKICIHNIMFLCALTMNDRGLEMTRNNVCSRFIGHFNLYTMNPPSKDNIFRIYSNILLSNLKRNLFSADIVSSVHSMVHSIIHVYTSMIETLRPTPMNNVKYQLNLRDISQVINGCSLIHRESVETKVILIRLLVHECFRVFGDRLSSKIQSESLFSSIKEAIRINFKKESFDSIFDHLPKNNDELTYESFRDLVFCNFMDSGDHKEESCRRRYEEVVCSKETLKNKIITYLNQYNTINGGEDNQSINKKLDILIFSDFLEHLIRLCRCLSIPGGNLLMLCSSGGTGRRSLARLSAFIENQSFFEVAVNSASTISSHNDIVKKWKENLKTATKYSGGYGKNCTFFIPGRNLKNEYLKDISDLISTGEVTDLFSLDHEKQSIIEIARLPAQKGDRNLEIEITQVMDYFFNQCREKLHFVLYLNIPDLSNSRNRRQRKTIGNYSRIASFPNILKNCLIDYYGEWPQEAFVQVGSKLIEDIRTVENNSKEKLLAASIYFFQQTKEKLASTDYGSIGPLSFIHMMKLYRELVTKKQMEITASRNRYLGGLQKLHLAAQEVTQMKTTLTALRPQLEWSAQQTMETMRQIEDENISVENATIQVKRDEEIANKTAEVAGTLKTECEADLAVAIPILEDAIAALNTLKPTDITLVKAMKNPPDTVKLVMAAVCVMLSVPPDRVIDPVSGKKSMDFWGPSKRILGDMNFLQNLKDYEKDNIPPSLMQVVKKTYITDKSFMPHIVAKASSAAEGLCKWVRAMVSYDEVAKVVAPKKEKLAAAERECNETMAFLNEKRRTLAALNEKLMGLNEQLQETLVKKLKLENEVASCTQKLIKAERLIANLGDEKTKWMKSADLLKVLYDNLPVDVLICSGILAYLPSLDSDARNDNIGIWMNFLDDQMMCCSNSNFSLQKCLEPKITAWHLDGWMNNRFYEENAVMVKYSKLWCLLIDPQNLANLWIRQMEQKNKLMILKLTDSEYIEKFQKCISIGQPVLLENIDDDFDATEIFDLAVNGLDDKDFHEKANFRFYITTSLANPSFDSYIIRKMTVINFRLPEEALDDRLLDIVMFREKPDLQEQYNQLRIKSVSNRQILKQEEENILTSLSNPTSSSISILEDDKAMKVLDSFKNLSLEIRRNEKNSTITRQEIDKYRTNYRKFTHHCATLYSTLAPLTNLNDMYQFSLSWFTQIYMKSIATSNRSVVVGKRLQYLRTSFTQTLLSSVRNTLFENHKLLYSFLLCAKMLITCGEITRDEYEFFFMNAVNLSSPHEKETMNNSGDSEMLAPCSWLSERIWKVLIRLETNHKVFEGIGESFRNDETSWRNFCDVGNSEIYQLPEPWGRLLSDFQKLILLSLLKPEKTMAIVNQFVILTMGKFHINTNHPKTYSDSIAQSYSESSCLIPLIFILPSYLEPFEIIREYGTKLGYLSKIFRFSLGIESKDEELKLKELIVSCQQNGGWVLIENCHIASTSIMSLLERIYEDLETANTALGFRLWLSSHPTRKFPIGVLQNGIKVTCDSPNNFKQALAICFQSDPLNKSDFFSGCPGKDKIFSKMLYAFSLFHAVLRVKNNFGCQSWNVNYNFFHLDFVISVRQLQTLLNSNEKTSIVEALNVLVAECNYGGKMTNNIDRNFLLTVFHDFCNLRMFTEANYSLFSSELVDIASFGNSVMMPSNRCEYEDYTRHIEKLSDYSVAREVIQLLGFDDNSSYQMEATMADNFFDSLMTLKDYHVYDDLKQGMDEKYIEKIDRIKNRLPGLLDMKKAQLKYPLSYMEPLNAILIQEVHHLNSLVHILQRVLNDRDDKQAVREAIINDIFPTTISGLEDQSINQLCTFADRLLESFTFFQKWIDEGFPQFAIKLNVFSSPKRFLSTLRTYFFRKFHVGIDRYDLKMQISKIGNSEDSIFYNRDERSLFGIGNIYVTGAAWDYDQQKLIPSQPRIMWQTLPFALCNIQVSAETTGNYFPCALYKSIDKRDVSDFSGEMVNYIDEFELKTDLPRSYWTKRSTTLFCQICKI